MNATAQDPQLEALRGRWPSWHIRIVYHQRPAGPGVAQYIASTAGHRVTAFDVAGLEHEMRKAGIK